MINIGIGVSWAKALYSVANNIIANFRARVLSYPNSIFEAGPCLDATLEELNAIGLLDNASLIVTPNAYNEGVLYDVIPNTPLGDMDVVRATTATRVNSAGLIEVVPRNLLANSNNLNNFNQINATKTDNVAISPSGLNNASSLMETATTTFDHYLTNTTFGSINNSLTYSVYLKQNGRRYVQLATVSSQGVARPIFDLQNGVYVSNAGTNPTITTAIENVGNGWFRCSVIHPSFTTNLNQITVILQDSATYQSYLGDVTKGVFVYGAQLENFATATEYFPTTTRLNIPRIDYTNGSCPSLLVEPQRTNLVTYSEQFDNSAWTLAGLNATVTANNVISPDGTQNADRVVFGLNGYLYQQIAITGWSSATLSIYSKTTTQKIVFGGATPAGTDTYSSINVGNGWFRQILTRTFTSGGTGGLQVLPFGSNETLYFWGAQLEQGSYATSYIPTVASSVTRNADVISKTGISSLIGQTEGTIFADIDYDANIGGTKIITGLASSGSSFIYSFISGTTLVLSVYNSGILQCYLTYALPSSGKYKIAIGYKLNDFIVYVNGANVVSQTSGTVPTCSIIYVGNDFLTVLNKLNYNSVQLYKTRLTDEQCILLTGDLYNSYAEMANSLNYILE